MRFAVVISLMAVGLIFLVSSVAIAVLSVFYTGASSPKKMPDSKIEIKWGEGS